MPLSGVGGQSIGGYGLMERLGAGGMGVVYLARSASGRRVAVKVVHAQFAEDEEFRVRFRQEVAAARRVSGAFTAPVLDADPDAEQPWMATLYIPGPNLAQRVAEGGPLAGVELKRLALGLVEALRDIHRAGLVHRDLKPANVLMSAEGPRVIDFGISRAADRQTLTATGRTFGTPPFMSPEQLNSARDVSPASDVFSLAALLVHAATGQGPFDADSPYMTAYHVVHDAPVVDAVPEPLRTIVTRCLDKDPVNRPGLDELLALFARLPGGAVEGVGADITLAGTPDEPPTALRNTTMEGRPRRRRPDRRTLFVSLSVALALTGLGVTAVAWSGRTQAGADASPESAAPHSPDPALPDGWRPWQTTLRQESLSAGNTGFDSGCVAAGQALYCGGEGFRASRLDSATGKAEWRVSSEADSSVPLLVRDETVVVNDFEGPAWSDDNRQWVTGLAAKDGKTRWTHSVAMGSAPVAFGERIVVLSLDERSLIAMNATDGAEAWRWQLPPDDSCEPWVGDGVLYAFCYPSAANSYQGTLWRFDQADGAARKLGQVPLYARPAGVDGDSLVLAEYETDATGSPGPYTKLRRVHTDSGKSSAVPLPDGTSAALEDTLRVFDGTLYVVRANGTVTALSARTGTSRWRRATEVERLSAPVLSEKYGALYFVNGYGRLLALRASDGEKLWQTPVRSGAEARSTRTASSQVALADDAIVGLADGLAFSVSPSAPGARPTTGATGPTVLRLRRPATNP
ncbi:serine/threonine-protein kinase [Streptomyces sp. AK02-01A]|uniref:serine/threonine-protein kinase n=1 Tax=Streptomyces sp. AK02-01A TaxID=3028648 RepID=UPI0029BE905C|nr:serine/threonine-protein kinase [Streptomyces sp. AK02-01A]MDX3853395.1 serine/threonine-protein kinase [Streptomyces sp. AK02-01A]